MNEILSVSQLTLLLKKHIESRFAQVSVQGEISNFKEQSSGHLYFTLKDAEAQIAAVLFKGNTRYLTRMPKAGDHVIAKGELNVYPPRGNYQLLIRELEFVGVGELLLKLHQLKTKLEQKGWFAPERKKKLPKFPKVIGVVTSPTGSVIQDILHVLNRRFFGFHLILNPVKVQGEGAALEIAQAIEQFNRYALADVLIVGRGGGSLEDLWAFNEEIVAAAIYASKIPIISAVGHETDSCIADFVADVRAPTPSAAAEMVIAEKAQHLDFLLQVQKRMRQTLQLLLREYRQRLKGITRQPVITTPYSLLAQPYQKLDEMRSQLTTSIHEEIREKRFHLSAIKKQVETLQPRNQLRELRKKLQEWEKTLSATFLHQLQMRKRELNLLLVKAPIEKRIQEIAEQKKNSLQRLVSHLRGIDPRTLLQKGYCVLFPEKEDSVILSAQDVKTGQNLRVLLHDGRLITTIKDIIHESP